MASISPRTPTNLAELLLWSREMSEYVRQITPRDGADIVWDVKSGGSLGRLRKKIPPSYPPPPTPFQVQPYNGPLAAPGDKGWVQVANYSMLSNSPKPDDKITITGLGPAGAIQLDVADNPRQYVWLDVDLSPTYASTPGPPTASIDFGTDWNGDSDNFWPDPVRFDTDDGTPTGSAGDAPTNRNQSDLFVPLAWTFDLNDNPWDPYLPDGVMLVPPDPESDSGGIWLVNVCRNHLVLYPDCYAGNNVTLAMPWTAPWDVASDDGGGGG